MRSGMARAPTKAGAGGEATGEREHLERLVEACRRVLIEEFGAKRVIPFGSFVEGFWHERSDLDLAVEGLPPERFFKALTTLQRLAPKGPRIDLVPLETAPPQLKARILQGQTRVQTGGEVAVPSDSDSVSVPELKRRVEEELQALERTVREGEELLGACADPPTRTELRAMASIVHEFYTGVEGIFRHIVVRLGEGLPRGAYWHHELLEQVAEPREQRPALISEPLRALLEEYLDFRHFFRHAYGYELDWVRLKPLVGDLSRIFHRLQRELQGFFEKLQDHKEESSKS